MTPKLGDKLKFATTVGSLAGWEYPMVDVQCYQDVNGDGTVDTNLLGPDIVFTWLDKPALTSPSVATRPSGPCAVAGMQCASPTSTPTAGRAASSPVRILAGTGDFDTDG